MRDLHLEGIDAFKNARNEEFDVVSQDGREGLVRPVNAVRLTGFGRHVSPTEVGMTRARLRFWHKLGTQKDGLRGWTVVLRHGAGERVFSDEAEVLVILVQPRGAVVRMIGQEIGDGIVTGALGVGGNGHHVRGVGRVHNRDGGEGDGQVQTVGAVDRIRRLPDTNLHGVRTGCRVNGEDVVVVQPR